MAIAGALPALMTLTNGTGNRSHMEVNMFALKKLVNRTKNRAVAVPKPEEATPQSEQNVSQLQEATAPAADLPALRGQKVVLRLLQQLHEHGQPLTLSRSGQQAAFRLTALAYENGHAAELLWLGKQMPAHPLLRLEPQTAAADAFVCEVGQTCRIEFEYQHITHYGSVCLERCEGEPDHQVHWFQMPATIYQNQRRNAFRVQITKVDAVKVNAGGLPYDVLNLSAGGLAIYVNADYSAGVGARFGVLQLALPSVTLAAEGEVRHVSRLGNGRRICGLRLHFAERHSMDELHRFVLRKQLTTVHARK